MVYYTVITKIPKDCDGNRACSELIINPDAERCIVGSNIIVNPPSWDDDLFVTAIKFRDNKKTTIDLTKKQMLFCSTPVFKLGEILIMGSDDRSIPDGRKPSKWDVETESFKNINAAVKRANEVLNDEVR